MFINLLCVKIPIFFNTENHWNRSNVSFSNKSYSTFQLFLTAIKYFGGLIPEKTHLILKTPFKCQSFVSNTRYDLSLVWRSFLVKLYFVCYKIIFALCAVLNIWSCIMYVKAHLKNLAKCLKVLKQLDSKMACFSDLKAKILKLFILNFPYFFLKMR